MTPATRLYSPDSLSRVAQLGRAVSAAAFYSALGAMAIAGCRTPTVQPNNIVRDHNVRECSGESLPAVGGLDVAIVIDTSQSTGRSSGSDIDQDGTIRSAYRNSVFNRGDSRLAAQIAAVRPLIRNAANQDIRFSIVTYSGATVARTSGVATYSGTRRDSKLRAPRGSSTSQLESVLDEILKRGSEGSTIFYAGMRRAILSLVDDSSRSRRRIVLFMSDSAKSTGPEFLSSRLRGDPRMKNGALVARDHGIVFHTFGLSDESGDWREMPIGQIAGATGGTYHAVADPRLFYCHLADSLVPRNVDQGWQKAFADLKRIGAASDRP